MRYHYLLTESALATYSDCTARQRAQLREAFLQIAEFPDAGHEQWSIRGFDYAARRFGRWSISWRVDSPVKEVHVIRIEDLQRAS